MAALRPSLEYGCEVWNTNKCQAKAFESIQFRAGGTGPADPATAGPTFSAYRIIIIHFIMQK